MTQTESFTNSEGLAPWKRGEVPLHWPDFAADREVVAEPPPMLRSEIRRGPLVAEREVEGDSSPLVSLGELESDELSHAARGELRRGQLTLGRDAVAGDCDRVARDELVVVGGVARRRAPVIHSELADDNRLALEAFKSLDELEDEDELSLDDDLDLAEDTSAPGDYIPALIERTHGTLSRVASKVLIPLAAVVILVIAMGGTWSTADATPAAAVTTAPAAARTTAAADDAEHPRAKSSRKDLSGKLNLNTASEDQLMMLPTVGPSKADRIVAWRKKNGGFKRTADLRHVKGFGYKTFKKLEPFLDVKGDTTLVAK